MAIVIFNQNSYECARAVKGVDYIKLYDENNNVIVAFASISDFSAFTLQEGEWEKGISTETVSANAKLVGVSIQLDLLKPTSIETGLTVTFQAPCDYTGANNITIQGISFSLVDALGVSIVEGVQAFVSGAMVAVILNRENLSAYIQNAAVSPHKHSSSDVKNLEDTLNGKANASHKHSASDINSGTLAVARGGTGGSTPEQARKNLGVVEIVTGTYTGELSSDGSQFINLGKTPKAVYVTRQGYTHKRTGCPYGGLALNGTPSYNVLSEDDGIVVNTNKVLEIVDNGFRAYFNSAGMAYAAKKGNLYSYIAWF